MKPILYSELETSFDSNGNGILHDAISCYVDQDLNGKYELELRYPVTGGHFKEITDRKIVLASVDPVSQLQPFRIYRRMPTSGGIATYYARHIAYDAQGIPVSSCSATSAQAALHSLKNKTAVQCPFDLQTDKATGGAFSVDVPTSLWKCLGGTEGSVLDIYGGEYEFDRYDIHLWNRRGADRGVTIRYGKNLTSLEQDANCANCHTGVYPYWTDTDGGLVELPEKIVHARGTYNYVKILTLDCSNQWELAPTAQQLREYANAYMDANQIGVPDVSWKIEFVNLEQTEEYKGTALLEQILLGDNVSVVFPALNVDATARASSYRWDVLMNRYDHINLGNIKANLAKTIAQQKADIERKPSISLVQAITMKLTAAILGAMGGAVRLLDTDGDEMPDTLYVADNPNPELAKKVWRWNYEGWAGSKTGYSGPFTIGATLEDGLLATAVTAANLISGTIQSADDGKTFFLDLDNGVLRMQASEITVAGKTIDEIAQNSVIVGGRNLLKEEWVRAFAAGDDGWDAGSYVTSGGLTYSRDAVLNGGFYVTNYDAMAPSTQYTVHFKARQTKGAIETLFLHGSDPGNTDSCEVYMDGALIGGLNSTLAADMGDGAWHDFRVLFKTKSSLQSGTYDGHIVQFNKYLYQAYSVQITGLKWERGNKATDWSPAPEDQMEYAHSAAASEFDKFATQEKIFDALTDGGKTQGIYLEDGKIYINMEYLSAGTIAAEKFSLRGLFEVHGISTAGHQFLGGYIGYREGSLNGLPTDGIMLSNGNMDCYVITTTTGVRIQAGGQDFHITPGGRMVVNADLEVNGDVLYAGELSKKS